MKNGPLSMQRRSVDMLEAFMPYFGIAHSIKDQSGSLALSDFKLYEVPKVRQRSKHR